VGLAALAVTLSVGQFVAFLPATYPPRTTVDFPAYHQGGRLLLDGEIERLYSGEFKEFQNLPLVTIVLAPLGALPYARAWTVLWWTNVLSIVVTLAILLATINRFFPPLGIRRGMLATALYFAYSPIMHRSLVLGQTTPVMVLLLAGVVALIGAGKPSAGGAVLGVVGLVKIPPVALVGVFLARRRLSMVAAAVTVLVGGVAASVVIFGGELNLQYVERVIWTNAGKGLAAFNNQSMLGTLLRAFTDRSLTDWTLEAPPLAVAVAYRIAVPSLLGLLLWRGRRRVWPPREPPFGLFVAELGLGIGLMLLIFPIVWIHYFQFLVVPVTLLPWWWKHEHLPRDRTTILLVVLGVLLSAGGAVRVGAYYTLHDDGLGFRLLQSYRTAGALLLTWGFARTLAMGSDPISSVTNRKGS
jgi:hypothetical protein